MPPFFASPALIAAAAALAAALPSAAQSPTPAPTPAPSSAAAAIAKGDPGDPKAGVPSVTYRSAFTGYRPAAEAKVGAWKDANDNVGRIGGWRVYAREARDPQVPAEGSKPMPPGAADNKNN